MHTFRLRPITHHTPSQCAGKKPMREGVDITMNLAERLKQLRKEHRYSQRTLAQATNGKVNQSTIAYIEQGLVKNPRRDTIEYLARVFDLTPAEFWEGVDIAQSEYEHDESTNELDNRMHTVRQFLAENPDLAPVEDVLYQFLTEIAPLPVSQEQVRQALEIAVKVLRGGLAEPPTNPRNGSGEMLRSQ